MLAFLAGRAIPGVEQVEGGVYRRTLAMGGAHGTVEVAHDAGSSRLRATIHFPRVESLWAIVARVRRVFDLAADLPAITRHLARDPLLAPLVAARPGLRVPGGWDGFELAVRAVLGQQISVVGARTLAGRLVERCGAPLAGAAAGDPLQRVFPAPEQLAALDVAELGMPRARAAALVALARAAAADPRLFGTAQSLDDAVARLVALPGIGPWTAQYVALRALREPDAFPAGDLGLLRALAGTSGQRPTPRALLARAEAWSPWRAYAAQHLWTADATTPPVRRAPAARKDQDGASRHRAAVERAPRDADRRPRAAAGR
jgi:AraC family transcriptional regulator of adaptative response / DNA-3-methyladenine glycosylase II